MVIEMDLIKYIIIAIIQGLTEPLPISSSGHMFLFKKVFNTNMFNDLNFEIICNFGSFLAILYIFRKDVIKIIKDFFTFIFNKDKRKKSKNGFKYAICIVISSIPVAISGLLFKDFIENKLQNVKIMGFAFLLTALSLFIVRNIKGEKNDEDISYKDAIIIGLFQMITILPGISRSGTVLVACLLCKLKKDSALKYTFMLYFPVSVGAMILGVSDLLNSANLNALTIPYLTGMVISLIVTLFSYRWLSNAVKKGKLVYFSIYCVLLAMFIFIYFR